MPRPTKTQHLANQLAAAVTALVEHAIAEQAKPKAEFREWERMKKRAAKPRNPKRKVQRRAPDASPVLVFLRGKAPQSIGVIAKATGAKKEAVARELRELREAGAVRMTGVRRGAVWQVVGGKLKNGHAGARA